MLGGGSALVFPDHVASLPDGVTHGTLDTVEITGTVTPRASGEQTVGTRGTGSFAPTVEITGDQSK